MKRIGIIGRDFSRSQAKRINTEIGDPGELELVFLETESTEEVEEWLANPMLDGFSIAYPYRTEVIRFLDDLSDDAKRSNSVNVVKRMPGGGLKGLNTNIIGFADQIREDVPGKKCLILGTGSMARSTAEALKDLSASEVVLVSRDPEAAEEKTGGAYTITGYDRLPLYYDCDIMINCTPVGRFPDIERSVFSNERISFKYFTKLELAIDLIYDPYRTKFLQDAKRFTGCRTKSGLDMFIIQALSTRNVLLDVERDHEEEDLSIRRIKRKVLESQLNVIAVGLPGSGKTTIFRRYAYELGKKFIDTDEKTEELMGQKISDVIAISGLGEEYFRASEHSAVKKVCEQRGAVIATGGSTLLNPVNRDILRANGIVIYVKRPIDMLNIKGSPLNINNDMREKMFGDRDRIFRRVSDITLVNARIFGEKLARTGEGNSYNYELKGFVYFIARKVQKYLNQLAADKWT